MAKSTVMAEEWLDHYFLNSAMAGIGDAGGLQPSATQGSIWVSAHTANPGVGGTQSTNEATYTGYSRSEKTRSIGSWNRSGTTMRNNNTIACGTNSGASQTITHICYGDDEVGAGKLRYILEMPTPIVVGNGESLTFAGFDSRLYVVEGVTTKSTVMATEMVAHFFLNAAMAGIGDASGLQPSAVPGNLYLEIHSATPGVGGTQATNEMAYAGYNRVAIPRTSGGWTQNTTTVVNAAIASMGTNAAEGTVTSSHLSIGDDPSGAGKLRYLNALSKPWTIIAGMTPRFLVAEIAAWEESGANTDAEFGHRKHERPEELVRLKHHQPISTEPIVRYDLDTEQVGHHLNEGVPLLINPWRGHMETPETSYLLSAEASSANPFEEVEYTATNGISTQHLWGSERACTVTRWRSVYGAPYNLDLEWMSRTGPSGLGQGLGGSEFIYENEFRIYETQHNPTHGGSANLPVEVNVYADEVDAPVSPPLYTNFTGSVMEGAVIPMEWDGDGSVQGNWSPTTIGNSRGAEADAVTVCYWRNKQFQRVDPHFNGSLFVHRITYAFYRPYGMASVDFGGASQAPFGAPGALRLSNQYGASIVHSGMRISVEPPRI
jgi:hypothetical protein